MLRGARGLLKYRPPAPKKSSTHRVCSGMWGNSFEAMRRLLPSRVSIMAANQQPAKCDRLIRVALRGGL
jgi:hypothetical protein